MLRTRTPALILGTVGLVVAMAGTYWDDSWHTDRGRDEFAAPPHLVLYAGVALTLCATLLWALCDARSSGWRTAVRSPALRLAATGAVTTIVSAPIDEWWHQSFGRDAVLWSPPHLLGVAGMVTLAAGLLAGASPLPRTTLRGVQIVLAAGVIGALQVPVLEYDSDVPQFSTRWYLPVSIAGACASFWLVDRLVGSRWIATAAAMTATVLRVGVIAFLEVLDFSPTTVPPLIAGALAFDLAHRSKMSARLWCSALALTAGWAVAISLQPTTAARVETGTILVIGAIAAAGLAVTALPRRPASVVTGSVAFLALSFIAAPRAVSASPQHDPGQGVVRSHAELVVERNGPRATVFVATDEPCADLTGIRTVARRAGRTVVGDLDATTAEGGCAWTGTIEGLTDGGWFFYVELADRSDQLETWVHMNANEHSVAERRLVYAPVDPPSRRGQVIAGIAIFAVIAALATRIVRLATRTAAERAALVIAPQR